MNMIQKKNIKINEKLYNFINNEALKGIEIDEEIFWNGFSDIVDTYYPKNVALLGKRKIYKIKSTIGIKKIDLEILILMNTKNFLKEINYIVDEGPDFKITTSNVDEEISTISGPQLVVPITNARFAINAVNARWGSSYDALYGNDALGEVPQGNSYDPERGNKVVGFAKSHLDKFAPLENIKWSEINKIELQDNKIILGSIKENSVNFVNKKSAYRLEVF